MSKPDRLPHHRIPQFKPTPTLHKDGFQLVETFEVLIADDLDNRRTFGEFGSFTWNVDLADPVTEFYESVGAGYLSNHTKYTVKPRELNKKTDWARCSDVREAIVEKLPIFLHEFDKQRLKNHSLHLYWDQQSRFLVRGCRDLSVEKRLDPNYCVTHERREDNFEFLVSAESTTDADSSVTLWLKKAEHIDIIVVALCRLLFKTHKKHDVLSLMTILETDKETLRRRGYDVITHGHFGGMLISLVAVDRIKDVHKAVVLEDRKKEKGIRVLFSAPLTNDSTECEEQLRKMESEQRHYGPYGGGRFRSRFFDFLRLKSRGSKGAGMVKAGEVDKSIEEILEQLVNGEATPEEQEIRNREHRAASKKLKDVEYCAEQKGTDLELVDVDGAAGLMRVWKQADFRSSIAMS
ncbi:hypothetical protein M405DRAFT_937426 [Rhizopogon salebrosus TDB-379]|nr:hypothetical protein M405DRAFT_937426 [Rhizopogon salebrosus TDB-379]